MESSVLSYYEEKQLLENHDITSLIFKKFILKLIYLYINEELKMDRV